MSTVKSQSGYIAKLLNRPFETYEDYAESKEYVKMYNHGVFLNYDLTLCYVVNREEIDFCFITSVDNITDKNSVISIVDIFDFLKVDKNWKHFVNVYHNSSDNPLDELKEYEI